MLPSTLTEHVPSRETSKSAAAFRTIAEVASELDLPAHVLRFWESKFSQVKPLKRRGGRRYYRPEDVVLLRRIRSLLYTEGYTIKGVQRLLRESGAKLAHDPSDAPMPVPEQGPTSKLEAAALPRAPSQKEELRAVLAELQALRRLLNEGI